MPLPPKSRLGTYEILGPLGAGGMGEVYRARDTRLGREVAIKRRFTVERGHEENGAGGPGALPHPRRRYAKDCFPTGT